MVSDSHGAADQTRERAATDDLTDLPLVLTDADLAAADAGHSPSFAGFPGHGARYTGVPDAFFSELLPQIDDIDELKAVLFVLWRVAARAGDDQLVTFSDLAGTPSLLGAFGEVAQTAVARLRSALEAGVRRGALLEVVVPLDGRAERVYLPNSPAGAARADRLRIGEVRRSSPIESAARKA